MVTLALILLESLAILAAAHLADTAYHFAAYQRVPEGTGPLEFGAAIATLFALFSFFRDDFRSCLTQEGRTTRQRLLKSLALTFVAVIFLGFLTKTSDIYSRGGVIVFFPLALTLLFFVRGGVVSFIRHATRVGWLSAGRIFVVGFPNEVTALLKRGEPKAHGYDIAGVERLWHAPTVNEAGKDLLLEQIVEKARWSRPDTIILALPWSDTLQIDRCVRAFMQLPVRVELAPERVLERFSEPRIARIGPIMTLNVLRPPLGHTGRIAKRTLDVVLATTALVLLAPVFLGVAAMIRLDSEGPALFRQTRYGFNQQRFRIWKFRTMSTMDDGEIVKQASQQDIRVTRIGKILRRWNIDELPQLFNVLKGEMSLVGPRPHAVAHNRIYENRIDLYARRHNVLPGITGWAQVHGLRGATDDTAMLKRVEFDLYYLDNWSIGLDVLILFMTIFSRNSYRNAY